MTSWFKTPKTQRLVHPMQSVSMLCFCFRIRCGCWNPLGDPQSGQAVERHQGQIWREGKLKRQFSRTNSDYKKVETQNLRKKWMSCKTARSSRNSSSLNTKAMLTIPKNLFFLFSLQIFLRFAPLWSASWVYLFQVLTFP